MRNHPDFDEFINRLCAAGGVRLRAEDLLAFEQTQDTLEYISQPPGEQLRTNGISVHEGWSSSQLEQKGNSSGSPSDDDELRITVQYGLGSATRTLEVHVYPKNLTPLGLTILSWVFIPGVKNVPSFLNILKEVAFENCLVNLIQQKDSPVESHAIVIPAAWLYWLNLPYEFVSEHVELFNLAARVAEPNSKQYTSRVSQLFRRWAPTLRQRPLEAEGASSSELSMEHDVLLLDENNRLVCMPSTLRSEWEITGVNAAAGAMGFSLGAGYSRQHTPFYNAAAKLLFAGYVVQFYSLSHFIRYKFEYLLVKEITGRMDWLKKVLDRKAVFPNGTNQGFLTGATEDSHLNTHVDIFPDNDCRVTLNSLKEHKVYQDQPENPNYIYFLIDSGRPSYKARCLTSSDMHLISSVTKVTASEIWAEVSFLHNINKDLG